MMDLDEVHLAQMELRTRKKTSQVLHGLFPFTGTPHRDATGTLRLGFGRPIERRPITMQAADLVLTQEIINTQQVLRGRVFELVATHPEAEDRLPYIYAAADILGAETLRDWDGLWASMRNGDWEGAAAELGLVNWSTHIETTKDTQRALWTVINRLQLGIPVPSMN